MPPGTGAGQFFPFPAESRALEIPKRFRPPDAHIVIAEQAPARRHEVIKIFELRRGERRIESDARINGNVCAICRHTALRIVGIEQTLAVVLPRGNFAGAVILPRKTVFPCARFGVQFEEAYSAEKGTVRHEHAAHAALRVVQNLRVDGVGRFAPMPAGHDERLRNAVRAADLRGVRQKKHRIIVAELRGKTAVQPIASARRGDDVGRP